MINLDFSKRLKDISCPTLVLYGEKDTVNRAACEKIAISIPKAAVEMIENAGHEINVDAPEQLSAAINSFFNKVQSVSLNYYANSYRSVPLCLMPSSIHMQLHACRSKRASGTRALNRK